jgi:hypothetical protein
MILSIWTRTPAVGAPALCLPFMGPAQAAPSVQVIQLEFLQHIPCTTDQIYKNPKRIKIPDFMLRGIGAMAAERGVLMHF